MRRTIEEAEADSGAACGSPRLGIHNQNNTSSRITTKTSDHLTASSTASLPFY